MIGIPYLYFDHAATTKVCPPAVEAAIEAMTTTYGNPSSLHHMGLEAENTVSHARRQMAKALGCTPDEVIFTSCATESNNIAIFGAAKTYRRRGNRIVTTTVEHPAVARPVEQLEQQGWEVVRISPKNGRITPEQVAEQVDRNTVLVSCMHVNNETGLILPVEEIARQVKRKNPDVLFHVDAVQSFCKLPFQVKKFPVDLLSISGHKIYAPKGVGALYKKKGIRLAPLLLGGGQEQGLRSGTESVPLIAALGAAAEFVSGRREAFYAHYQDLNKRLRQLLAQIPDVTVNSPAEGAPYTLNFSIKGIRSEIMLHFLEQRGISVSSGSACSKGAKSGVLAQLGCTPAQVDTAIRVSFGYENSLDDLELLAEAIGEGTRTLLKQRP